MGWLIRKTYLKWTEPKLARRTRDALEEASSPWWGRPTAVFILSGLILLNWFVTTLDPQKKPLTFVEALPWAVGGSLFVVYLLPWVYYLFPSYIRVQDRCIQRIIGNSPREWKYSVIQACRILREGTEDGIDILEITTQKGRTSILGIAPTVSLDELQRVLTERGVPVCRVELPSPGRG